MPDCSEKEQSGLLFTRFRLFFVRFVAILFNNC